MVKHIILWQLKDEYSDAEKADIKAGIKAGLEGLAGSPLPCANVCDTAATIIAARRMILFFLFINRFLSVPWGLDCPVWRLILLFTHAA